MCTTQTVDMPDHEAAIKLVMEVLTHELLRCH